MKIGFLGVGATSAATLRRLLHRQPVHIFGPGLETTSEWVELGAMKASSASDLMRQCEVVFLCSSGDSACADAVFGYDDIAGAFSPGMILVDQTPRGLPAAEESAARLSALGVAYVAASVMCGETSDPHVVVSGPLEAKVAVAAILKQAGCFVQICEGERGNAHTLRILNDSMAVGCKLAMLEIVAMGRKMGLSLDTITKVLNKGTGRNHATQNLLPALALGQQTPQPSLADVLKDLELATGFARQSGVPMLMTSMATELVRMSMNAAGEGATSVALVDFIENMTAVRIA